jgi:hypothetical protein
MRWNRVTLTMAGLLLGLAFFAGAGDGTGPVWICSIKEAVEIDEDGTIGPPDLGGLDRPTFMRVDAGARKVTLLAPESRRGEVTKIDAVHQSPELWVFSGVEEGRAWSMVIAATGHMTLSVTGDGATWTVFGNALREKE